MLKLICPVRPENVDPSELDAPLRYLLSVVDSPDILISAMAEVVRSFGFDSFLYAMTTENKPDRESRSYYWANQPPEWVAAYEANAYIEVDPRITLSSNKTTPLIWDSARVRGDDRTTKYLQHASRYGIRSGVVCAFRDVTGVRMGLMLNSSISPVSDRRLEFIRGELGKLMLFSAAFHDLFMSKFVRIGIPPLHQGTPLSPREVQCLTLAARGMTSADIGFKLGITERTANFHFSNIITKLNVLNRHEAIARAVGGGLIKFRH